MKQITILASNANGLIADVTKILANAAVNIESIAGEHYGSQTVVTATVDDTEKALEALRRQEGFQAMAEDALLLRVEDEVGALAKISQRLDAAGIDIRSIRFVERHDGYALVALSVDRSAEARHILKDMALG